MEALQVMGEISEQQVQQLMKLRELMLADMSSKQSYQAAIIQRQAASEAATERFLLGRRRYLMERRSNPAGNEEHEIRFDSYLRDDDDRARFRKNGRAR
jgi:hypothetical protein